MGSDSLCFEGVRFYWACVVLKVLF